MNAPYKEEERKSVLEILEPVVDTFVFSLALDIVAVRILGETKAVSTARRKLPLLEQVVCHQETHSDHPCLLLLPMLHSCAEVVPWHRKIPLLDDALDLLS